MAQPSLRLVDEARHHVLDRLHRVGHGGGDRVGQAHPLVDVVDLTSDHDRVRRRPAEGGEAGEHRRRIHRVRIQTDCCRKRFMIGLEDVQGARRTAIGQGVDEHQGVASVEQVVGQVHAPDSVVHHPDASGPRRVRAT